MKKIPIFNSDEEAERFVATADLTEYDLSHFKPVRFEFEPKAVQINMRVPKPLLDAMKEAGAGARHPLHTVRPRADRAGTLPPGQAAPVSQEPRAEG